jgi:hypothetical protein
MIIISVTLLSACRKESTWQPSTPDELDPTVQKSQITRVMSGNIHSSLNLDPSLPPMECTGDLPGLFLPDHFLHGNTIHLGEWNWQQSSLHHASCNLSFATMQLTTSVSGQIAAANGDLIYYSGNDVIDVTNLLSTPPGPTGSITGTWTITGGTGRFEEAAGSITINGEVNFATGTFTATVNGTITY